jgi:serine protease Do
VNGRAIAAAGALAALFLAAGPVPAAGLPDVIEGIKPSIVAIGTLQATRSPAFAFRGSGFAVGDGSLVATNAHVIPEILDGEAGEALVVAVPGSDGKPDLRAARSLAIDAAHDIALLRISGAALPALRLHSGMLREGDAAAFTGFPLGAVLGLVPVTHRATIAALTPIANPGPNAQRLNEKAIRRLRAGPFVVYQLDGTAYPGSSGSALYDAANGEVVGIVNMTFVKGSKESAITQPSGISFAVPARYLAELLQEGR